MSWGRGGVWGHAPQGNFENRPSEIESGSDFIAVYQNMINISLTVVLR